MRTKKVISLLTALVLMVSAFAITVSAADGSFAFSFATEGKASAKTNEEVTFNVNLTGTMGYVEMKVDYDATLFDYVADSFTSTVDGMYVDGVEDGTFSIKYKEFTNVKDTTVATFKLVACNDATLDSAASGTSTISAAFLEVTVGGGGTQKLIYDKDGALLDFAINGLELSVVKAHTAPSITGVTVTPAEAVVGTELTATTVGFSDNWGLADASTFTWVIGDKTVSTSNKYTPVIADINKTITVTATPAVSEELAEAPFTGEPKSTTVKVVIPADYAPTVEVAIGENGEVLAAMPVEPVAKYDETYKEVTEYAVDYTYYVVPAELVAEATGDKLEAAIAAVEAATEGVVTLETNVYSADNKDDYAIVKAEATYTIGGEAHATKPVDYAAALIKGEPPTLDETANGEKLAAKKLYTSSSVTVAEKDVKFTSNAVGDDDSIAYTYEWYLTEAAVTEETFDAAAATAITGTDALPEAKGGAQLRLSKVDNVEGKYLTLVVTATDALGIPTTKTVCFTNAIKKASSSGSGTAGGATLVPGKTETEEPGTDVTVDPDYVADTNVDGDPTDGKESSAAAFTDVDKEVYAWGYDYLDKLAKAGVVKGMTATTYEPESMTTYAQFTALVVRVLKLEAADAATEKVAAEHWSYAEVSVADKLGLLADVAFDADKAITREDMAVIAHKALEAKEVELTAGEAVEYSDASSISEYAAECIDALSKAGILNGMGDGTFAPKGTTTRMQTAKVIGMIAELVD